MNFCIYENWKQHVVAAITRRITLASNWDFGKKYKLSLGVLSVSL